MTQRNEMSKDHQMLVAQSMAVWFVVAITWLGGVAWTPATLGGEASSADPEGRQLTQNTAPDSKDALDRHKESNGPQPDWQVTLDWRVVGLAVIVLAMALVEGIGKARTPTQAIQLGRLAPGLALALCVCIAHLTLGPHHGIGLLGVYCLLPLVLAFILYTLPSIVVRLLFSSLTA